MPIGFADILRQLSNERVWWLIHFDMSNKLHGWVKKSCADFIRRNHVETPKAAENQEEIVILATVILRERSVESGRTFS